MMEEDHFKGGEEETASWGGDELADHDIRPTAEAAVYGRSDPRMRWTPSRPFITT